MPKATQVHFDPKNSGSPACGADNFSDLIRIVDKRNRVTCASCRHTKLFRKVK